MLKKILKGENKNIIENYDNVFIDCPPSLSLLTIMALVTSDEILVPLQTEFFALEGISQLVKTIDRIKVSLNPSLEIRGYFLPCLTKEINYHNKLIKRPETFSKIKFTSMSYLGM